jgi:hypothetical protein
MDDEKKAQFDSFGIPTKPTELDILRDFYIRMKNLAESRSWPETKEERLYDAVERTARELAELV